MTSPAITISPDATLPAAARLMSTHHIRRLPVTNPDGTLAGIISRRDLLSVFLRPDADIAAGTRQLLAEILPASPASLTVTVKNGVVTLTRTASATPWEHDNLIPAAIRLIWDIDGVIDVQDHLSEPHQTQPA